MSLEDSSAGVELPMERPLFAPPLKSVISTQDIEAGEITFSADALFDQVVIDKAQLASRIRQALQSQAQVSLAHVVERNPLEHGLAELVAYLSLAGEDKKTVFDESVAEHIPWKDARGTWKSAQLPRVLFNR